eukprot:1161765-Pelagomonas_calceolata.AAC.4
MLISWSLYSELFKRVDNNDDIEPYLLLPETGLACSCAGVCCSTLVPRVACLLLKKVDDDDYDDDVVVVVELRLVLPKTGPACDCTGVCCPTLGPHVACLLKKVVGDDVEWYLAYMTCAGD